VSHFTVGSPGYKRHVHLDLEHGRKSCLQGRGRDDVLFSIPHPKVRVPGFGLFGQDGDVGLGMTRLLGERFEKNFEGRIIALLGGITVAGYLEYPFEIPF